MWDVECQGQTQVGWVQGCGTLQFPMLVMSTHVWPGHAGAGPCMLTKRGRDRCVFQVEIRQPVSVCPELPSALSLSDPPQFLPWQPGPLQGEMLPGL